jgi:hypothetical protein
MAEYEDVSGSVEVPKNAGIRGFLKVIEDILKLPRVQSIHIDSRGNVEYRHFLREGESSRPVATDFESLLPYAVIRNSRVAELSGASPNAAVALCQLFNMAAVDHLFPVALVGGANTQFWSWYATSTGVTPATQDQMYGVPFLRDRLLEDHVVVLCAAYTRSSALVDTQRSYKLVIPQVTP